MLLVTAVLATSLLASACATPGAQQADASPAAKSDKTPWGETPVAAVGDGVVTLERLNLRLRQEATQAKRLGKPPRPAKEVLDELVEQELLVQAAVKAGHVANDDDVRARLVRRVLQEHKAGGRLPKPTPAQLRQFYEAHKAEFPDEERLRLSHILLRVDKDADPKVVETVKRRAEALRQQVLRDPKKLPLLARQHSKDPSAARGGDLGYLPLARWLLLFGADFARIATATPVGKIGPLVRSRQGFHIFQITERVPKGTDPLKVQFRELLTRYQQVAKQAGRHELVAKLRKETPVSVRQHILEQATATP